MALDVYRDWLGIPDGPRPPDHYSLLRLVEFEDDVEKVRENYKQLNEHVRKYASGTYSVQSQELLNELAKVMLCLTDPERKREYDEGRGRTFEEDEGDRTTLAQTLLKRGCASRAQLKEAVEFGERRGLSLRDAVVQMKIVDAETAAEAMAEEMGIPYVDLSTLTPDMDVLRKVPRNVVKRNSILPLFIDGNMLLVACVDEPSHELEDELRLRVGVPMRRLIATPGAVNAAIDNYYAEGQLEADESSEKKKPKKKPKKKKERPKKPVVEETDAASAHSRKQVGIILMCWSIALPAIIDLLVLPTISKSLTSWLPEMFPFLLTPLLGPAGIWWVLKVYWKK